MTPSDAVREELPLPPAVRTSHDMSAEEHAGGAMRQREITIGLVCTHSSAARAPNNTGSIVL